ncbi:MAG TPA: hypothetical protein VKV26_23050 [Dehalococcoidia bacterium]|nr:hypothetical protein [Dehalococcoidia bacterium]
MQIRHLLVAGIAAGALLALPAVTAAAPPTRQYGPITTVNDPDSGTCGNNWATDAFKRLFTANTVPNSDGSYSFDEAFIGGSFVTSAGASPGACETLPGPTGNGHTVAAGVRGEFSGSYRNVTVSGGTFNPAAVCTQTSCDNTTDFVHTVYGPGASFSVSAFFFQYQTAQNGDWTNASPDLGGNSGDIFSN